MSEKNYIEKRENYRVVVEPDLRYLGSYITRDPEGLPLRLTNDVAKEIKRHVDGIRDINVEFDTNKYCKSCGYDWTEQSPLYNGGCCAEDEKNNPETSPAREAQKV